MSSRILTNIENIFSITLPFHTLYRQYFNVYSLSSFNAPSTMSSRILTNIENIFSITLPFHTSYRQLLFLLILNASCIYDVTFRRMEFFSWIWSTAAFHLRSSRALVRKRTCASLSSRSETLRVRWSRGLGTHVDLIDISCQCRGACTVGNLSGVVTRLNQLRAARGSRLAIDGGTQ